MGAEQKKVIILSWSLAFLAVLMISTWDVFVVLWAVSNHPPVKPEVLVSSESIKTDFKRDEQKYFLASGIYIPIEDIMFMDQLSQSGARYSNALQKHCSSLNQEKGVAIWLPLKIRMPIFGEIVKEWCWKPRLES
jgi:hypothetical protein